MGVDRVKSVVVNVEDGIRVALNCAGGMLSAELTPENASDLAAELILAALMTIPDDRERAALQDRFDAHMRRLAVAAEHVQSERLGQALLGSDAARASARGSSSG